MTVTFHFRFVVYMMLFCLVGGLGCGLNSGKSAQESPLTLKQPTAESRSKIKNLILQVKADAIFHQGSKVTLEEAYQSMDNHKRTEPRGAILLKHDKTSHQAVMLDLINYASEIEVNLVLDEVDRVLKK